MGTNDKTSTTTDFFSLHLAQCQFLSTQMAGEVQGATFKADLDASILLCQTAIAAGNKRTDMPATVAKLPVIITKYTALPNALKDKIKAASMPAAGDPK